MRHHRRFLATAGIVTAGAGLLLALSVPLSAGSASAAPEAPGCDPAHAVTTFHFTVNGKTMPSLHGNVHEGDQVEAFFTIATGCRNIDMALVSHTAADAYFVRAHVNEQRVFDAARGSFGAGSHTLGPVRVPQCDFQVDFEAVGTKSAPGFTYSSATGGTTSCEPTAPSTTTTTVAPTTTTRPAAVAAISATTEPPAHVIAATVPASTTLPFTGSDTGLLVGIAAALLAAGGAMIALSNQSAQKGLRRSTSATK